MICQVNYFFSFMDHLNAIEIDPMFLNKNFNAKRYVLREVVGRTDKSILELLDHLEQQKIDADEVIQQVVNENFATFSTSLRKFTEIYKNFHGTHHRSYQYYLLNIMCDRYTS